MLNLPQLARRAERIISNNSPVILTGIAVAGSLMTAYLAGKASFKAAEILAEENFFRKNEAQGECPLEFKEKVALTWKLYIPAATTGLITVACIIGANRIENRRAAALAGAFALSEKSLEEYRAKVVEKFGERKERAVRDDVAQDQVRTNPPSRNEVIVVAGGQVLCYEAFTGRYFMSSMEKLLKAQNDINRQILFDGFASLSDLYDYLGLPHTDVSNLMGWNSDQEVQLKITTVISEDDRPCFSFSYSMSPFRTFTDLH